MLIGYARVSTQDQSLDAQIEALKAAGCELIFSEKMSGAKSDRPQLAAALKAIRTGDTLVVTRLDRLARSSLDLLTTVARAGEIGASFRSLADAWADTSTPHGKLMMTVLAGLAEFERSLIAARVGEGRIRAMAAGVKFGRKRKLSPFQTSEIAERLRSGEDSIRSLAKSYGVSPQTIGRIGR